jgi:hypothetical protein
MRSQGRVIQDLPMVRVAAQNIQKGSLNDPVLQGGILYLNAAKTSYLYIVDNDLYYQPPSSFSVKLT